MAKRLDGKVAVITGAGRGLGRAEALALAAEGSKIVVNDLGGASDGTGASQTPAEEVVQEIKKMGGDAVANYDSVATPEGGENIIKTAIDVGRELRHDPQFYEFDLDAEPENGIGMGIKI